MPSPLPAPDACFHVSSSSCVTSLPDAAKKAPPGVVNTVSFSQTKKRCNLAPTGQPPSSTALSPACPTARAHRASAATSSTPTPRTNKVADICLQHQTERWDVSGSGVLGRPLRVALRAARGQEVPDQRLRPRARPVRSHHAPLDAQQCASAASSPRPRDAQPAYAPAPASRMATPCSLADPHVRLPHDYVVSKAARGGDDWGFYSARQGGQPTRLAQHPGVKSAPWKHTHGQPPVGFVRTGLAWLPCPPPAFRRHASLSRTALS